MKRLFCLAVVAAAFVLTGATLARAQFDTPNRSFHQATGFPLEGRHQAVACESCHLDDQYQATPTACESCHWQRRKDDPYQTTLGLQCGQCHRPTSWTAVQWDHAAQAGVPLNAEHRTLACQACHTSRTFTASVNCVSCHQRDYAATTAPNHAAAGFPVTCDACHRPSDSTWASTAAGFDHHAVFPLTGVHATQACQACHVNNVFQGTPRDCIGCHRKDFDRTTSPNHAAAGFPTTCETCHQPSAPSWSSGSGGFNHASIFALVGTHATVQCAACHVNNVFQGTPRECVGCHRREYDRTTNPNHAAANFPTTCETCHQPAAASWSGAGGFNHASVFPLVGVHATVQCAVCHANNRFQGTPRDCVGCHRGDYDHTTAPNHVAANFPTTCDSCHRATDSQWLGATFNHTAYFALVGRHAAATCASCHLNNVYQGTPRDCVGCHLTQYNATRNPSHASAGFPTTCDNCHRPTDSAWTQGTFVHSAFPLSGPHNRPCADCHTTPNNYAVFSCTVCHSRSETDGHHRSIAGYRYDSTACYACHPNGRH
jgi:hypothetical protein